MSRSAFALSAIRLFSTLGSIIGYHTDEGRLAKTQIQFKIIKYTGIRKGGIEHELYQDFGNIFWLVHDRQFWNLAIGCSDMDAGDSIH